MAMAMAMADGDGDGDGDGHTLTVPSWPPDNTTSFVTSYVRQWTRPECAYSTVYRGSSTLPGNSDQYVDGAGMGMGMGMAIIPLMS